MYVQATSTTKNTELACSAYFTHPLFTEQFITKEESYLSGWYNTMTNRCKL